MSAAGRASLPAWLVERLDKAPRTPGCYLMKDRAGEVVYVGKASDLKARLGQYFAPSTSDTRFFVGLLDRVLGDIEVIITANPKEALVLENQLIKAHKPRFNYKLRDDKTYLSIRIGSEHAWPRLEVVRRRKDDGAEYFGPYDSASAIRRTLRVANRYFGLRTCRDVEFNNRSRPCLEHQIGRCPGPCVLDVPRERYEASLDEVRLLLRGRADVLTDRLRARMEGAAERLEFELAAHYRDQVEAIERSLVRQHVHLKTREDIDVIGLHREGADGVLQLMEVRGGVLTSSRSWPVKGDMGLEQPDEDLVEDLLAARYGAGRAPVPDLVVVPIPLAAGRTGEELLGELRGRRVEVRHPQRGDKARLLELASRNAEEAWASRVRSRQGALKTLERLQDKLGLERPPTRIECYDISNIQGTDAVGSMVVALDGELAPKAYRHFSIRGEHSPDDFRMMYEVLSRRLSGTLREGGEGADLPDLIVVDGGKGQLGVAVAVLEDLQVSGVELAGLAKQRLLDEEGRIAKGGRARPEAPQRPSSEAPSRSPERVFRPGRKNPIVLRPNTNELHLLVRLRDEAHRFAITFHRKRRKKRTLTTALDGIPGVGPSRRKALLERFGSVKGIRAESATSLATCPGISEALARRVLEHLEG